MRLWSWRHKFGQKFQMTEPLVRGSLFHIGLAHHYIKMMPEGEEYMAPLDAVRALALRESDVAGDRNVSNLWISNIAPIAAVVDAYTERYSNCSWKPIAVEQELRAHIPRISGTGNFLFTQRADLIVEDHGLKWIVDHKSTYRITSKTLRQHTLSGQFLGYQVFGRKMYGKQFGGVILNRVKLRAPYDFDRIPVEPAPAAINQFISTLKFIEDRIERYQDGTKPEDFPAVFSAQTCFGKYGACPAFELCRWGMEE